MPSNTPNSALPYPLPTEPVSQGAAAIQALAEAVDPLVKKPLVAQNYLKVNDNGDAALWTRIPWFDVPGLITSGGDQFLVTYDGVYLVFKINGTSVAWIPVNFDPGSGWIPFTPQMFAGNVNPGIGSGSATGRYQRVGSTIHARATVTFGPDGTAGDGQYEISLPVAGAWNGREANIGTAFGYSDTSSALTGVARMTGPQRVALWKDGQPVWAYTPAWVDGSSIFFEYAVTYNTA